MNLLILFVSCTALGFAAGWYTNQRIMIRNLTDMIVENIKLLTHEVLDGQHFLYFKEDGKFAAQGSSLEEAAKNFSQIHNGVVGRVIPSTGAEFFIVDGVIETAFDE